MNNEAVKVTIYFCIYYLLSILRWEIPVFYDYKYRLQGGNFTNKNCPTQKDGGKKRRRIVEESVWASSNV